MAPPDAATLMLLISAAFGAGFVDAVVGGGGPITTPVLLLALPGASVASVLATTKCASVAGTLGAAASYARSRVELPWRVVFPAMVAALPASLLGARLVSHLDASLVRPAILAVLVLMALYVWWRPGLGDKPGREVSPRLHGMPGYLLGATLGFYDGFLGPGTGSMLVVALILIFGRTFLQASAAAKFINAMSNLGALLWFISAGLVLWKIALPMAGANLAGGLLGSRKAMTAGNGWIRRVFLVVVWALIARLAWNLYG